MENLDQIFAFYDEFFENLESFAPETPEQKNIRSFLNKQWATSEEFSKLSRTFREMEESLEAFANTIGRKYIK